jgi:hypothetical protein
VDVDPASLDPEERMNKFYALFAIGFGVLSLCGAIIPICGGLLAVLGVVAGIFGRRSENKTTATIGIALSIIGLLTVIVYSIFLYIVGT